MLVIRLFDRRKPNKAVVAEIHQHSPYTDNEEENEKETQLERNDNGEYRNLYEI
jgi:hypothetical protein